MTRSGNDRPLVLRNMNETIRFRAGSVVWAALFVCSCASNRVLDADDTADAAPGEPDAPVVMPPTDASGDACEHTCSADMHSVIDCQGNLVQACDSAHGCAGATCIAACD